jgi:hypothetical protein
MTALVAIAVGIAFAILLARILLGGLFQVMFRLAGASGAGSGSAGRPQEPGQAASGSTGGRRGNLVDRRRPGAPEFGAVASGGPSIAAR